MTDLHCILYCSRNSIPGDPAEVLAHIEQILAVSRRNNERDGVTGGLLYSAGAFAQVLEGPPDKVAAAFERIQCDERHADVTVVTSGPVKLRAFTGWSMAFKGLPKDRDALAIDAMNGAFAGRTASGETLLAALHDMIASEDETRRVAA